MPNTQALIGGQGMTFTRAYIPYPLCCPSRASMLTGEYMHNHGVRGNAGPFGGWERLRPHESDTVATLPPGRRLLQRPRRQVRERVRGRSAHPAAGPRGLGRVVREGLGGTPLLQLLADREGGARRHPRARLLRRPGRTSTRPTFLGDKAVDFIDTATADETPFMMNVWFNAPHGPFDPAPRHLFTLSSAALPKLQAFDEKDLSDKPKWLRKQARKRLGKALKQTIASERRRRLEQLLSVDEAVGDIVAELSQEGLIDDTYIIFASDNGFFRGEHRIAGGKYLAYEPSSRVPLMIRGPGITAGGAERRAGLGDRHPADDRGDRDGHDRPRRRRPLVPALRAEPVAALDPAAAAGGRHRARPGQRGLRPPDRERLGGQDRQGQGRGPPGVKNLDQEKMATKTVANGNFAPAYRAVRTTATSTCSTPTGRASSTTCCSTPPSCAPSTPTRATASYASSCSANSSPSRPAAARAAAPRPARTRRRCRRRRASGSEKPAEAEVLAPLGLSGPGALAKLDKAPASKVGDSRFESWVPRSNR